MSYNFSSDFKEKITRDTGVTLPVIFPRCPTHAAAEWKNIWLSQKDVERIQSVCLFCACKSSDSVSEGYGGLMLFRLISFPSSPRELSLQQSSILFPASLHPYRTNDHGSGQLLNAVVSSVLLSDSSSIALDATEMHLLHSRPPHRLSNVVLEHLWKGVLDVCHITFAVYDYRQGSYHFS